MGIGEVIAHTARLVVHVQMKVTNGGGRRRGGRQANTKGNSDARWEGGLRVT